MQVGERKPFAVRTQGRWVGRYYDPDGSLRSAAYADTKKEAENGAKQLQQKAREQRALCNKFNLLKFV